ncbi:diguanylate cyclase [Peptacetobacter hominis]|uniref:Diguanylate cyclase n=1 Tax=Peptacetobacter hominis TaxID=2743610 RepID=A0A544QXD7_9FIRM|nr:NifB/NifX family molybdenum-iron cluster-binding protein [Peptacetobacter hominis]TQQ85340.1 diguanylate cyclase [Peptacetobacter hominis]
MKVCFPVKEDKGLDSVMYNHFGTAPIFIVCDTETDEVVSVENGHLDPVTGKHPEGGCNPVKALNGAEVDVVVVAGIGKGAATKLGAAGIKVYQGNSLLTIGENFKKIKEGGLLLFDLNNSCTHHHH